LARQAAGSSAGRRVARLTQTWILHGFYKRLREKGKPFKVALVATMRKLITIPTAIANNEPAFQTTVA